MLLRQSYRIQVAAYFDFLAEALAFFFVFFFFFFPARCLDNITATAPDVVPKISAISMLPNPTLLKIIALLLLIVQPVAHEADPYDHINPAVVPGASAMFGFHCIRRDDIRVVIDLVVMDAADLIRKFARDQRTSCYWTRARTFPFSRRMIT